MFSGLSKAFAAFFTALILVFSLLPEFPSAAAKGGGTIFTNATPVTINTLTSPLTAPIPATLYPSAINVTGMTGTVTKVEVTLKGFNHEFFNQVDMLLVGPTGARFVFMADAGGSWNVADRVYTFADDAPTTLSSSNPVPSGQYRPTSGDSLTDVFPSPAPAGPHPIPPADGFASVFNGSDPNGEWRLFAVDDTVGNRGFISGGWELAITTGGQPQTFSNPAYIGFHDSFVESDPYGTAINVSGLDRKSVV